MIDEAVGFSLERLTAMAAAMRKKKANELLTLIQGVSAGFGNATAFKRIQERLMEQAK